MRFSVVIPVLNEESHLRQCLESFRDEGRDVETIVVDGGSGDRTVEVAVTCGARVVTSEPGRGVQQNAGARIATGDILLFLHADTRLPRGAFAILDESFKDEEVMIGSFRSTFDSERFVLGLYSFFSRFESPWTTFGDQCLVMRKSFFTGLGGFPAWPLFEDVRFLELARKRTKIHKFSAAVTTSARIFVSYGPVSGQLRNAWLLILYHLGCSPHRLAEIYYGLPRARRSFNAGHVPERKNRS